MDDTTTSTFLPRDELAELLPGYRLDDEPVSTTGMSRVYLATDTKLHHRKVAVKIMADYLAVHPGFRKRFLREIQLMAGLEHPNIVYVITAAADTDRLLYLVMPRAEGDLRTLLRDGPLDLAETVHIAAQGAAALDFAHDHGVVHRDVKPGNFLLGRNGHVYLCDFGVARDRFSEDLTRAGESIGTRRYTAPEVFGATGTDAAAGDEAAAERTVPATPRERSGDVYSLGAVIYHCLTGRRPFDHATDTEVEDAQRRGDLPPVSELRSGVPTALDDAVAKAMHPDPEARFRTCGEFADSLAQAVGVTDNGGALPVLRDILARLPRKPGDPDATASFQSGATDKRPRLPTIGALTTLIALLMLGAVLGYTALDGRGDESDPDGLAAAETSSASAEETTPADVEPTVEPVTGDETADRRPVEGECINGADDYMVVACDSEAAVEQVYRIVLDPEDPNPSQPDHDDAAWLACGGEGLDYNFEWRDSNTGEDRDWNPETDRIYWIICSRDL